jgi:hypothetical protein
MKKKSHHHVPDFSHHPPRRTGVPAAPGAPGTSAKAAPPAAPRTTVKPHATSSKSGRRGE